VIGEKVPAFSLKGFVAASKDKGGSLKDFGPGVVLLVAELCRGYRCRMEKAIWHSAYGREHRV
jgi:hypothetical protein